MSAQKKNLRFQHFTTSDGLPQNMIDCIWEDSKGFMWFGTWNGLCRFDGYTFKEFEEDSERFGKKLNNFIYSIAEDNYGNLWIGTNDGLSVFKYNLSQYSHFSEVNKNCRIFSDRINSIIKSETGNIWVGGKQGLCEFFPENDTAKISIKRQFEFGELKNNLSGNNVECLLETKSGDLWIGTNQGINILKKDKSHFVRFISIPGNSNGLPSNGIQALYEDSNGNIWIGTAFGLSRYNKTSNSFINYFHSTSSNNSLVHNSVTCIAEDFKGNIIIGTLGGISIYNNKTGDTFNNYTNEFNSEFALNNDFVSSIYKDKSGNIWIGTERGGINKYNPEQTEFEFFEKEINNPNSLNSNTINSIFEDDKYIWIGTAGGGLNRFSKQNKTFTHITHSPTNPNSISSDFITSICRDKEGNLWIATWGGGFCKMMGEDSNSPTFKIYRSGFQDRNGLISDFISTLLFDREGNMWIGTIGGLVRFDPKSEKFEQIVGDRWGMAITQVGCLSFDRNYNLWVGTRFGLYKIIANKDGQIDVSKPRVINFKHQEGKPNSLSGNYIISILFDSNGQMWFGTYGNGLNCLISEDNGGVFKNYTISNGLSNNIIYTILEDNNGNIWLSTDNGLSEFDIKQGRFRNFYASDGLQNNQYYWSAAYKNYEGKLYFGGMRGLNTFFPEMIKERKSPVKVIFTDFKIFNESVKVGHEYNGRVVLNKSISETKEIVISYKSYEFLFEFSALDFEKSKLIEYAYKLEGFDKGWNYIGSDRRFASYTNLEPGEYTFKVKATNIRGELSQVPSSLKITILPPFWQKLWFRVVSAAFLISLILLYNWYRVYTLKMQKRKLEFQVKERTIKIENQNLKLEDQNRKLAHTKELIEGQKVKLEKQNEEILTQRDELIKLNKKVNLVNQYKLRFFTNISHEFRTPLTLIISPIEKLLKKSDIDSETSSTLNMINRNAHRLLHLINQLMDFRKIEKGKLNLMISKNNIVDFTNDVVNAFTELAKQKNIDLKLDASRVMGIETWFDLQKIENILFNLLSNAFKYTNENGKIWVNLYLKNEPDVPELIKNTLFEPENEILVIEVGDTGVGINQENLSLIFNRFYRTIDQENKTLGSGIGLSLTKELIKTHLGKIRVSSELGRGSVFYAIFPISRESYKDEQILDIKYNTENLHKQVNDLYTEFIYQDQTKVNYKKQNLVYIKKRSTVLIAEDNRDLREFLAIKLNENYNILEAENGKIAYDLAVVHNPSIIISDVMMPEMDGVEFCLQIKQNIATSHIPFIMLSAKSNIENRIEGLESGADDYLAKPFDFSLLEARIENLIESRKKLLSIFAAKIDLEPNEITSNTLDKQFLVKAIEMIENNIDNPEFGVSDMIAGMNMSRSTLHKKFIALTNQSTVDFINGIKLKKSISLLKNLDLNISEVAYSAGFNDPKYYSRIFKKFFGRTPTEYQKELSES